MIVMPLLTVMIDSPASLAATSPRPRCPACRGSCISSARSASSRYSDIVPATLKTVVFGFLIAVVSSYLGFTTSRGTEGVGEASTRSVVLASMLIILSDVILVKFIFFFYPPVSG